jgi:hypothetical protein
MQGKRYSTKPKTKYSDLTVRELYMARKLGIKTIRNMPRSSGAWKYKEVKDSLEKRSCTPAEVRCALERQMKGGLVGELRKIRTSLTMRSRNERVAENMFEDIVVLLVGHSVWYARRSANIIKFEREMKNKTDKQLEREMLLEAL